MGPIKEMSTNIGTDNLKETRSGYLSLLKRNALLFIGMSADGRFICHREKGLGCLFPAQPCPRTLYEHVDYTDKKPGVLEWRPKL
jgi:hypothetical protein